MIISVPKEMVRGLFISYGRFLLSIFSGHFAGIGLLVRYANDFVIACVTIDIDIVF